MNPIKPLGDVERVPSGWTEVTYAKDQPEYLPLPGLRSVTKERTVLTRWRLSWREWFGILIGRDLWLQQWTFGAPLSPVKLTIGRPEELTDLVLTVNDAMAARDLILAASQKAWAPDTHEPLA